ncbi:conserved hypothetical protein [Candidatus Terasakiella magnetica]|nr:conserved hypothetical protein [Candidatus Terasakiella magnetica]
MSYEQVEQAWTLIEAARDFVEKAGREVTLQEVFDTVFLPTGLVDIPKTQQLMGDPPKIFLTSPYGLQFRPASNDWIPFRHGPVTLPNGVVAPAP